MSWPDCLPRPRRGFRYWRASRGHLTCTAWSCPKPRVGITAWCPDHLNQIRGRADKDPEVTAWVHYFDAAWGAPCTCGNCPP